MGEVFAGRFELLDQIAAGGMGTVWRVQDRQDGQVKAAKILRQSDAGSLLRFVREQGMRIDHTHVVTPLSWAGVDDRVLFTMPLMRGGSVSDLLATHQKLPPRWVAMLTDQTLQALVAVHAAGIVHRDVKPGNLLLEATGTYAPHLRLTDFGIAVPKDEPRLTRAAQAIGTPGYMPPEQWSGLDPDPRSDLFAVGRVAYQMLTGIRPPGDQSDVDLDAARTGDAAHDGILDVIAVATSTDIDLRPPSATALRDELNRRGLLHLPPDPHDGVVVPDRFAHTVAFDPFGPPPSSPPPSRPPSTPPTAAPSMPPPPPPTSATRQYGATAVLHPGDLAPAATRSRTPGVLMLALGLIGLLVAAWLLFV